MVTGGLVYIHNEWVLASRVQEYSTGGAGERLPDLNTARYSHACGHYIKDDKVVLLITEINKFALLWGDAYRKK